jgi:hypothetical protein
VHWRQQHYVWWRLIGTASTPSQPKTNTADTPAHLSPRLLFKKNKKPKKKHAHTHKAQEKEQKAQAHKAQSTRKSTKHIK